MSANEPTEWDYYTVVEVMFGDEYIGTVTIDGKYAEKDLWCRARFIGKPHNDSVCEGDV